KLTVRIRKRAKLEGDDAKFKQSRYDGAFIANAMSEDEDEIVNGKKTGKYVSRGMVYRSAVVKALYESVDTVTDPNLRNSYNEHIRGDDTEIPPPVARKLDARVRRWMVSTEWLAKAENKAWDVPSRIAESGKAWGDLNDPEDFEEKAARSKREKKERKKVKLDGAGPSNSTKGKGKAKEIDPFIDPLLQDNEPDEMNMEI
ncbi:hypothetical protein BDP27DRAFT_1242392, partial [Rhodocollybia butyracea]